MHFMQIRWKMRAEIAKNKFSDIGLASSKGRFFERPNNTTCLSVMQILRKFDCVFISLLPRQLIVKSCSSIKIIHLT